VDLLPEFVQRSAQLCIIRIPWGTAQPYDDVQRRQRLLALTKALANDAADAIALHGQSQDTRRHRQSQPRHACAIDLNHGRECIGGQASTLRIQPLEFGRAAQSLGARQPAAWGVCADAHGAILRTGAALRRRESWNEALATLGATAREHATSGLGRHAGPKSMSARAAHLARLVRTFHDYGP
jgi:hypothetical protein